MKLEEIQESWSSDSQIDDSKAGFNPAEFVLEVVTLSGWKEENDDELKKRRTKHLKKETINAINYITARCAWVGSSDGST